MNILFRLLFMTSDISLESYVKPCEKLLFHSCIKKFRAINITFSLYVIHSSFCVLVTNSML